jgi:replicative DNA helicase
MAVGRIRTQPRAAVPHDSENSRRPGGPANTGGEAKSYFTGEDKIIIAKQRSGPAGTYIKVRFDGPGGRWEER